MQKPYYSRASIKMRRLAGGPGGPGGAAGAAGTSARDLASAPTAVRPNPIKHPSEIIGRRGVGLAAAPLTVSAAV